MTRAQFSVLAHLWAACQQDVLTGEPAEVAEAMAAQVVIDCAMEEA